VIRRVSRILLGWVFVNSGVDVLRNPHPRAEVAGPVIDKLTSAVPALPDDRLLVVRANAGLHLLAGSLLVLNKMPRLAALALAGSLVPTTLGGHAWWSHEDPAKRAQNRVHFNKNVSLIGGLLATVADPGPRARARARKTRSK
jgi:uncharacterized membrane protein YphA (DoxX/SURF4 family)